MNIDFILPDIGEGIVECEIVKWNVKEGDVIAEDQSVVEVMTDKAVVEIPAKHSGTVHKLYYKQGDIAQVHSPLFALHASDHISDADFDGGASGNSHSEHYNSENHNSEHSRSDNQSSKPHSSDDSSSNKADTQATELASNTSTNIDVQPDANVNDKWQDGDFDPPITIPGKVLASPAVRRIAREHEIDLQAVSGSGKKGRILKHDVSSVSSQNKANTSSYTPSSTNGVNSGACASIKNPASESSYTEKVRGIRAAMAKQMVASVNTIPHFTVSDEVRMDKLIALRQSLKPMFEAKGIKLSFMPFFVKALSLALKEFPIINSQLNDDGSELTYFNHHNIGFAVDAKIGLLVPNVKGVENLSLFEIAQQMHTTIEQAREGKLGGEVLKGGTISISNIGAIGGINATPVINKPEAAIVALGKTQKLPRFADDGSVEAHHLMTVNWSGDHRIIDGATMVRFNNLWSSFLEEPSTMLMHLK
ncbi:2-oxo acid dehydrogenase subunit E2 [Alteromonas sp. 1_MG-2023]|uniref:2-oxo acid dehydrogenase subunit E2 n=1 Tax=Alteromonas sp. 1_MG-2023 TaxID=3062669 RepID=UPI0026E1968F|nr:2-oxo acid dehydrogenase subunit E2 [Alteromonas sp. 1_MG-2023]MDO6565898.1 2-oxo acid dehydrogenase subunit E2 [Alteromonas sp. 1_MG-2023]